VALIPRLWLASLLVCGLFVAEDPTIIAMRTRRPHQTAGARLGRSADRIGASARDRRFHRVAALFEDLGAVNVLGVPGASLAVSTSGHRVSRRHSMRYCVLFVASWFVGANLIGWLIGRAHALPLLGTVAIDATGAIGEAFVLLTDVTQPIGAVTIAAMTAATVRYAGLVERTCRAMTSVRAAA
jgi:hypothetical protein